MATNSSLIFNRLTANGSNTDAASYAAATVTPVSGQIVLYAVASLKATTPDTPTVAGTGGFNGTWNQVGSTVTLQTPAANWIGLSVFWTLATSNTTGVVTASFGGNTQLAGLWDLVTSPFINTTTPVVQSNTSTDTTSGTTISLALSGALAAAANWVIGVFAQNANAAPGITSLAQNEYTALPGSLNSATSDGLGLKLSFGPSITQTMQSMTASVAKIAFLLEIAQDGTGVVTGGGLLMNDGFSGGITQ